MSKQNLRTSVLLSAQREFLGAITPNIRAIRCDWDENKIELLVYFDGIMAYKDKEKLSFVETEIIADFPEYKVSIQGIQNNFPGKIEEINDLKHSAWIYRRKEESSFCLDRLV